jgi:hypothetical protein
MANDYRPDMASILDAFGVAATVTNPDEAALEVTLVWVPEFTEPVPPGSAFTRREPRRIAAFSKSEVATIAKGAIVDAPWLGTDEILRWRVDGIALSDADHWRVFVVEDPDES